MAGIESHYSTKSRSLYTAVDAAIDAADRTNVGPGRVESDDLRVSEQGWVWGPAVLHVDRWIMGPAGHDSVAFAGGPRDI